MSHDSGVYLHVRNPEALHRAKGSRGVTLALLAVASGLTKGYISHLMTGRRTRVDPRRASRIEDALGVPRGTLFRLTAIDSELLLPYLTTATAALAAA